MMDNGYACGCADDSDCDDRFDICEPDLTHTASPRVCQRGGIYRIESHCGYSSRMTTAQVSATFISRDLPWEPLCGFYGTCGVAQSVQVYDGPTSVSRCPMVESPRITNLQEIEFRIEEEERWAQIYASAFWVYLNDKLLQRFDFPENGGRTGWCIKDGLCGCWSDAPNQGRLGTRLTLEAGLVEGIAHYKKSQCEGTFMGFCIDTDPCV